MNHSTKFRYPEPDMEVEETDYQPSDSTENSRAVAPLLSSKLKARFAKIHDERGSLSERRFWLKNNLHTKCSSCEERGLKCSPHPENIRCEACNRRKNGCSRVADERRDRTMRILRIDRRTYEALSTWYDKNKNWYKGEQVGQSKTASLDDKPINLPSVKKPRFSETTQRPQLKTPTQPVFRGAYMHATSCGSKTTSNAGVRAPIASNSNSGSRSTVQTLARSTVPVLETPHASKAKAAPVPSSSKTVRFVEDARSERAREKTRSYSEDWESEGSQEDDYERKVKVKASVPPRDRCQTSDRAEKPGSFRKIEKTSGPDKVRNSSYVETSEEEHERQPSRRREPIRAVQRVVERGSSFNDEEVEDTDEEGRVSGQKQKQKGLNNSKATLPIAPAKPSAETIVELVMLKRKVELSMGDVDRGTGLWSNLNEIRERLGTIATSQIDEMITHSESSTSVPGVVTSNKTVGEARRRRREEEGQEEGSSMKRIKTSSSRDPDQTVEVKQRQKH